MMVDSRLRAKARELIETGKLPNRLPDRRWGGPGPGTPCMVCGVAIRADEVGLELELRCADADGASNHHFHVRCLNALESELRERERRARSPRLTGSDGSAGHRPEA